MNDIIIRKICAKNFPEYAFIKPPEMPKQKARWKGTVEIPQFDFKMTKEIFIFNTIFTRPEVITASALAQVECLNAKEKYLLNFPVTKAVRIEEFEQIQLQTFQQSSSYLKVSWLSSFRAFHIRPLGLKISPDKSD